jgi:hypothetical protein
MTVTVIKEGTELRVIDQSGEIPDGTPIQLYTEEELKRLAAERQAMLDLQMPSFIRGDEDEDARDLF